MFSKYIIAAALVIVGRIHLLPLSGVIGSARLSTLYGIPFDDPNLAILMRHRAVLFGLLGLFLVYAAFRPSLQVLALFAGCVSVTSFLWLAYSTGQYNKQVATVFAADVIALVCLIIGALAYFSGPTVIE
jgi:hypothetical protein